jgi:hypothetical protein
LRNEVVTGGCVPGLADTGLRRPGFGPGFVPGRFAVPRRPPCRLPLLSTLANGCYLISLGASV